MSYPVSPAEQAPRNLFFGDRQEFQYDGCLEEINGNGAVEEFTIFFRNGNDRYGIMISLIDLTEDDLAQTAPTTGESAAIETELVDPQTVLDVLQWPSSILLERSTKVED